MVSKLVFIDFHLITFDIPNNFEIVHCYTEVFYSERQTTGTKPIAKEF
jgi:hypothetical protein